MDHQDRQAIEQLFGKLSQVEGQFATPDVQAAEFIRSKIAQQPNAPYYMAQTIVVQEQALSAAHDRIQQLEQEFASRPAGGGGFLSGLFGGGAQPQHRAPQPRPDNMQGMIPPGSRFGSPGMAPGMQSMSPGRGGGFLAGAAQTAMGVAGGVLLGNMIAGAFSGDDEKGGEASQPQPEQASAVDDQGDGFGGDFGEAI
jgi:hypothetical protein